jgi:hypothetical protein
MKHHRQLAAFAGMLPSVLAVVVSTACGSASETAVASAAKPTKPLPAAEPPSISATYSGEGLVVTYTVGQVMLQPDGKSVRRVGFSAALRAGPEYFLPVDRNLSVWYSSGGKHLSLRPRDGLTWGEVMSEADIVTEIE